MNESADKHRNTPCGGPEGPSAVKALALRLAPEGQARLRPDRAAARRLRRRIEAARRLAASGEERHPALQRLAREARQIEALIGAEGDSRGVLLPASGGAPRLLRLMEALLSGGEVSLTPECLTDALRRFDALRPLTQRELWCVPAALSAALLGALDGVTRDILRAARAASRAERWTYRPLPLWGRPAPAFCERAFQLCREEDLPKARLHLEARLRRAGWTPERALRLSQDARAFDALRLDNLLAVRRMIERLDWQACFDALSPLEAELRRDPSGVYPLMDDASRQAVREQAAVLAKAAKLPEVAVARHAVAAARAHAAPGAPIDCAEGEAARARALDRLSRADLGGTPRSCACWWLYDDAGRRALMARMGLFARLPRMIPDPRGVRAMLTAAGLAAALLMLLILWQPLLWPAHLFIAWSAAMAVLERLFPRLSRPARLLKLEVARVPEAWRTLVVTPVLLTDVRRAEAACEGLQTLGALDGDPNVDYLLLGDFADADAPHCPEDAEVLRAAVEGMRRMNARTRRARYAFLHRPRTLNAADGRYMGRDRKRGALMDLNRLLLGEPGAEAAFSAHGEACAALAGRGYRYVITLDGDTRWLPGTALRLIGAMAHPLNRRWAVMQPRMEMMPSACLNRFCRLFSGTGGLDAYPASPANLWMDLTGRGIYAGKGIYDIAAFHRALDGALPEGRVLSHDLIEGAIAGAAWVGDVALYDGCPATLSGWTRRQRRWTRGDWQLLPFLLSRRPLPNGRRLRPDDRFKMLDNLMRSLRGPAALCLLFISTWTGSGDPLTEAMLSILLNPLLRLFDRDALKWRRAVAELACLPLTAMGQLDAAVRALWRAFVSGRRLLEWVPSAEAEACSHTRLPGRLCAALVLPGLLVPGNLPLVGALAALFWVGTDWIQDMEARPLFDAATLSEAQRAWLLSLARDTWRFFDVAVTDEHPLPPDNVQIDPPAGAAHRTSPTNIGLYWLGCLAAFRLQIIDGDELFTRLDRSLAAVERMPKWRGHLYNWVDTHTLRPVSPLYVSAVDSGNLAACCLACARGLRDLSPDLAHRLDALARGMDFKALYDGDCDLFYIGVDAESGRPGQSHYDLLASESRILSFTAILLKQAPLRHWARLGRAVTGLSGEPALLSWSGTLFEYLMPELLMKAPDASLLGETARNAVRAQARYGARNRRPWGISESGYHAFDAQMNYQYRAFGLKALALSGECLSGAVAPYAAALALGRFPAGAADNLKAMEGLGWRGEWGFYEAADYLRPDTDGRPRLVKSHMAHHQGMTLCALCNALTDDSLVRDFMGMPEARAIALLLEERPVPAPRARASRPAPEPPRPAPQSRRAARPERLLRDVHLLGGNRARAFVTDDGRLHFSREAIDATRFPGDLLNWPDAARAWLCPEGEAPIPLGEGAKAAYDAGCALWTQDAGRLRVETRVCLSPEDDTLFRTVRLTHRGSRPLRLRVVDAMPVSLAAPADMRAHAAFQHLFVEAAALNGRGALLRRRPRNPGERCPMLAHIAVTPGDVSVEADWGRLVDREGRPILDVGGGLGATLNPASALEVRLALRPGQSAEVCFAARLTDRQDETEGWLERCARPGAADRAARLSRARTEAMLGFLGLTPARGHRLDRLAALLLDPRLASRAKGPCGPCDPIPKSELWALGLSGDRPVIALFAADPRRSDCVRALLDAHAFYRWMGLTADLALVDDCGGGYARAGRDMLTACLAARGMRDMENRPGGAFIIDGAALSPERREALLRASAMVFCAERDFDAQLDALLRALSPAPGGPSAPPDPGADELPPESRLMDNGFGGFVAEGYAIDVRPGSPTPAPWCNLLADDRAGALLTERGGGFLWHGSSRFGRMTEYRGDPLRETWGLMLYLYHPETNAALPLLPGEAPRMSFRALHAPDMTRYRFLTRRLDGEVTFRQGEALLIELRLTDKGLKPGTWQVVLFVDWLMGADVQDAAWLKTWHEDGAGFACGAAEGVGFMAADTVHAESGPDRAALLGRGGPGRPGGLGASGGGYCLRTPIGLERGATASVRFAIGAASNAARARAMARSFRMTPDAWVPEPVPPRLTAHTPDEALNRMMNAFLPHQALASRVLGRTGYCQPGGAWGFRDQLQDMLALLPHAPERLRTHLLDCAAHQFEVGDAMHWWHPPFLGVRTRISDDRLFLPFAAAAYVKYTGDAEVLNVPVRYLKDVPIPEGREDVFCEMRPGDAMGTLHEHCMRAFESVGTGVHGLALMGAGDWNDGMNRVGAKGSGESVWLSEFIAACADAYAAICPDASDAARLVRLAQRHRTAVETHGWDGRWYRRAWADDGTPLGSADSPACRIDLIAQAWAVLAGLGSGRCKSAMDAVWDRLLDEARGVLKLLDPPFGEGGFDPGYIRDYPAGVRENGAQYTHAACWYLLALIRMGDADRAHRLLAMLLPPNRADTHEKALRYRVEPYVTAADIYALPGQEGRGGWTWYTGSAAWLMIAVYELLGFERRGDLARLNALLADWPEAGLTLRFGSSAYRLVCRAGQKKTTLDGQTVQGPYIRMVDDGNDHEALFPPRGETSDAPPRYLPE